MTLSFHTAIDSLWYLFLFIFKGIKWLALGKLEIEKIKMVRNMRKIMHISHEMYYVSSGKANIKYSEHVSFKSMQPMRLQGSSGCIRHLTQHLKSPSNEPAVSWQLLSLEWVIWKVNANSNLLSESEWCANGPEVFWSCSRGMLVVCITRKNFLINQEACVHGQMVSTPLLIYFK